MATEKVTLYGVPLVADRRVNYGRIDPELSRALFIRHALVEGDWQTRHHFFAENRALLEEVEDLENRARRRDILVDDQTLYEFYDARVPADVVSVRHFDTLVEEDAPRAAGPAVVREVHAHQRDRRWRPRGRLPGLVDAGHAGLQADLPVRAGRGRGRRHRAHPAAGAEPGDAGRLRLAGAGTARGTGHRS